MPAPSTPPLENGWAPAGACRFLGNRADRVYCAVTGAQLLANPSIYDGQLLRVNGWVVADRGGAALYLTRDAQETSQTFSLVSLYGSALPEISTYATERLSLSEPVAIQVAGRFRLHGLNNDGVRNSLVGVDRYRFGRLEGIEDWRP